MGDLVLFKNKAVCCVIVGYLPRVIALSISDPVFYVEKKLVNSHINCLVLFCGYARRVRRYLIRATPVRPGMGRGYYVSGGWAYPSAKASVIGACPGGVVPTTE